MTIKGIWKGCQLDEITQSDYKSTLYTPTKTSKLVIHSGSNNLCKIMPKKTLFPLGLFTSWTNYIK